MTEHTLHFCDGNIKELHQNVYSRLDYKATKYRDIAEQTPMPYVIALYDASCLNSVDTAVDLVLSAICAHPNDVARWENHQSGIPNAVVNPKHTRRAFRVVPRTSPASFIQGGQESTTTYQIPTPALRFHRTCSNSPRFLSCQTTTFSPRGNHAPPPLLTTTHPHPKSGTLRYSGSPRTYPKKLNSSFNLTTTTPAGIYRHSLATRPFVAITPWRHAGNKLGIIQTSVATLGHRRLHHYPQTPFSPLGITAHPHQLLSPGRRNRRRLNKERV